MTIDRLRRYRKSKSRKLLLQDEVDKMVLAGKSNDPELQWRQREIAKLNHELKEVRDYIDTCDPYIGTMLRLHYVSGRRWRDIAQRQGGGNSEESIRKMCHRYITNDR